MYSLFVSKTWKSIYTYIYIFVPSFSSSFLFVPFKVRSSIHFRPRLFFIRGFELEKNIYIYIIGLDLFLFLLLLLSFPFLSL